MSAQTEIRDQRGEIHKTPITARASDAPSIVLSLVDWVPDLELGSLVPDDDKRACRLTVDLVRVIYMGEDIGSEWRYWVWVDNSLWDSGERNLRWQEIDALSVRIIEGDYYG